MSTWTLGAMKGARFRSQFRVQGSVVPRNFLADLTKEGIMMV